MTNVAYNQKIWRTGDNVTAVEMNRIEQGIKDNETDVSGKANQTDLDALAQQVDDAIDSLSKVGLIFTDMMTMFRAVEFSDDVSESYSDAETNLENLIAGIPTYADAEKVSY